MCWYVHFNKGRFWYSSVCSTLGCGSFVVLMAWLAYHIVIASEGTACSVQCAVSGEVGNSAFSSFKTWWLFAVISEWGSCFRSLPRWSLWRLAASEQAFLGSRGAPATSQLCEDPGATCSFAHFLLRVLLESVSTAGEN